MGFLVTNSLSEVKSETGCIPLISVVSALSPLVYGAIKGADVVNNSTPTTYEVTYYEKSRPWNTYTRTETDHGSEGIMWLFVVGLPLVILAISLLVTLSSFAAILFKLGYAGTILLSVLWAFSVASQSNPLAEYRFTRANTGKKRDSMVYLVAFALSMWISYDIELNIGNDEYWFLPLIAGIVSYHSMFKPATTGLLSIVYKFLISTDTDEAKAIIESIKIKKDEKIEKIKESGEKFTFTKLFGYLSSVLIIVMPLSFYWILNNTDVVFESDLTNNEAINSLILLNVKLAIFDLINELIIIVPLFIAILCATASYNSLFPLGMLIRKFNNVGKAYAFSIALILVGATVLWTPIHVFGLNHIQINSLTINDKSGMHSISTSIKLDNEVSNIEEKREAIYTQINALRDKIPQREKSKHLWIIYSITDNFGIPVIGVFLLYLCYRIIKRGHKRHKALSVILTLTLLSPIISPNGLSIRNFYTKNISDLYTIPSAITFREDISVDKSKLNETELLEQPMIKKYMEYRPLIASIYPIKKVTITHKYYPKKGKEQKSILYQGNK